jgi:Dolichyl-phosphate-mannose-protein mannosyltransferase
VSTPLQEKQIQNFRPAHPTYPSRRRLAVAEPPLEWQDVPLSFLPPARRTSRAKERLAEFRFPLIVALQAALTWRLNDIVNDDEALYIHGGHVVIAHLMHGGAANAALLRLYGSFFSGAPNAYPVVAAVLDSLGGLVLVRFFSLCCMLTATVCVYKIGRYLFSDNVALLASLVFALTGSVQFIGKLATYDAPCLLLVAIATMLAITKNSIITAPVVGALLAVATVTKYTSLAVAPFVLLLTFLAAQTAEGLPWRWNFPQALLRGVVAALVFTGLLAGGYRLWGSGISVGIEFTTTGRKALDPTRTVILLESLLYDIGLTFALAISGILLMLRQHAWAKVLLMTVMVGAGSIIQASSVRIHEFISLDKHTYFSGFFCAVPAAVALDWAFSRRGRTTLAAVAIIWLLFVDGLWRSSLQYSWPSSIMEPISVIEKLNIPGEYFSFDSDTGEFYTQGDPKIDWYPASEANSIFGQGLQKVVQTEKGHQFTGFLFQTTNLSAQSLSELHVLDRLLASDPYYFETGTFKVNPYTKAVWQLWIHYPAGYRGPVLNAFHDSHPGPRRITGQPVYPQPRIVAVNSYGPDSASGEPA